jgi:hypothetical protein
MVVRFGGLACLQGRTAVADANGYFTISVFRNAGDTGIATAVTTDWWSLTSDEAEDYIY